MIDVTLLIKNEKRLGFAIKGHANFDQHGYDIVCALLTNYNEYVNLNYREV